MTLTRRGKYSYSDSQDDIRVELAAYSSKNYPISHFADAVCTCGGRVFAVLLDEDAGVAIRICQACAQKHSIGDSADYLAGADLEECQCPCDNEMFEVTVGVALYEQSNDVKWVYLGCRCVQCGLVACYGDWKNEFEGYEQFLSHV